MHTEMIIIFGIIAFIIGSSLIAYNSSVNKKIAYDLFAKNNCSVTYKFENLLIDENNKKWAVKGVNYLFSYDDISDYEYVENGNSYRRNSLMAQAITNSVTSQQINNMYVTIYTKVPNYPKVSVYLITTPISTNSMTYNLCKSNAETLIGRLKQMIPNDDLDKPNALSVSAADEIAKYKSLLDNGAITQEEYDKKKIELLNL